MKGIFSSFTFTDLTYIAVMNADVVCYVSSGMAVKIAE